MSGKSAKANSKSGSSSSSLPSTFRLDTHTFVSLSTSCCHPSCHTLLPLSRISALTPISPNTRTTLPQPTTPNPNKPHLEYSLRFFLISSSFSFDSRLGTRGRQDSCWKRSRGMLYSSLPLKDHMLKPFSMAAPCRLVTAVAT